MYNTASPTAVVDRTSRLLKRTLEIQERSHGALTFEDALTAALDEGVLDALQHADPRLAGQLTAIEAKDHPDVSNAGIAKNLDGHAGISEAELAKALAGLPSEVQASLREVLAREAQVYSARRVATEMIQLHQNVMRDAAAHGVTDERSVFFNIARRDKSYGMMALAHRQATGTAVDRYIAGVSDLDKRGLGEKTAIVVLDDVAGSGNSLLTVADELHEAGYRGRVILAPLVAAEMAQELFFGTPEHPDSAAIHQYQNLTLLPGRVQHGIQRSALFGRLPLAEQQALLRAVGKQQGYLDGGLAVAFPYMSPDNNLTFFGDLIAQYFIVNRNRRAAKSDPWKGPAKLGE